MTELEKMIVGKLYDPADHEITAIQNRAHELCRIYNSLSGNTADMKARDLILRQLLPKIDFEKTLYVFLLEPIFFDMGINTVIGSGFYANAHLTVLDSSPVTIGNGVQLGANVSLLTATHPLRYQERNFHTWPDGRSTSLLYSKPITICSNCWLASNVTVTGGVTIGEGSVIGAGSVVTRDIPENVFAAGVPCRVIRPITEDDKLSDDLFVD